MKYNAIRVFSRGRLHQTAPVVGDTEDQENKMRLKITLLSVQQHLTQLTSSFLDLPVAIVYY